jgi:hypothetical protein
MHYGVAGHRVIRRWAASGHPLTCICFAWQSDDPESFPTPPIWEHGAAPKEAQDRLRNLWSPPRARLGEEAEQEDVYEPATAAAAALPRSPNFQRGRVAVDARVQAAAAPRRAASAVAGAAGGGGDKTYSIKYFGVAHGQLGVLTRKKQPYVLTSEFSGVRARPPHRVLGEKDSWGKSIEIEELRLAAEGAPGSPRVVCVRPPVEHVNLPEGHRVGEVLIWSALLTVARLVWGGRGCWIHPQRPPTAPAALYRAPAPTQQRRVERPNALQESLWATAAADHSGRGGADTLAPLPPQRPATAAASAPPRRRSVQPSYMRPASTRASRPPSSTAKPNLAYRLDPALRLVSPSTGEEVCRRAHRYTVPFLSSSA